MNFTQNYQQVPLTDDDRSMLLTIYQARLKTVRIFVYISIGWALCFSFLWLNIGGTSGKTASINAKNYIIKPHSRQVYSHLKSGFYLAGYRNSYYYNYSSEKEVPLEYKYRVLFFLALTLPFPFSFLIYFYRKVLPYKIDIRNGVKNKVPYVIQRKQYFDVTGQYYVGLADPKYHHHEVTAELYHYFEIGDVIYLYRAPLSGYTFGMNGRFTI